MLQHENVRNFDMVDVEVGRKFFLKIFLNFFLGNENNFMTHDECEAMCDELIQDHPSRILNIFSLFSFKFFIIVSN